MQIENNKIKQWLRTRCGALKSGRRKNLHNDKVLDLYKHMFRTNVEDNIGDFMKALAEFKDEPKLQEELNLNETPDNTEAQATDSESDQNFMSAWSHVAFACDLANPWSTILCGVR